MANFWTKTTSHAMCSRTAASSEAKHRAMQISRFERHEWMAHCERLSDQAARQSELSYTRYVVLFSDLVDEQLPGFPSESHEQAIELAERWGYTSAHERHLKQQRAIRDEHSRPMD
ncbi:MAG: hypothetical protein ACK40L_03930 [Hydrogenophaga sp.]